jgi:hypothetical protein
MDAEILLYYIASVAGAIMVVGGMWLLYTQKIYIDRVTNKVTNVETPLGSFSTNVPALVLFVIGFVPLLWPIYYSKDMSRMIRVNGNVESSDQITVYAVVQTKTLPKGGAFTIPIPIPRSGVYSAQLLYIGTDGRIFDTDEIDPKVVQSSEINVTAKKVVIATAPIYEPVGNALTQ